MFLYNMIIQQVIATVDMFLYYMIIQQVIATCFCIT